MKTTTQFRDEVSATLDTQGFTETEQLLGAVMAQAQAAMHLIGNPIGAMVVSSTFSKLISLLTTTTEFRATPERVCAAADIVYEASMAHTKAIVKSKGGDGAVVPFDASSAVDPKDN
jgi:hypothetical protein